MPSFIRCWPKLKAVGAGLKKSAAIFKRRHPHRIHHRARRTAGIIVSKPAAIVWTCAVVGGIGWAGWPVPQPIERHGLSTERNIGFSFSGKGFSGFVLPVEEQAIELPLAFAATPDCCSPGPLYPQPPEISPEQPKPVPEPGSLALLATGVAATVIAIAGRKAI